MLKRLGIILCIIFALASFTVTASAYELSSVKYIYVDDDGTITRYATGVETLEELFKYEKIQLDKRDKISTSITEKLETGMVVTIFRSKKVSVSIDNVPRVIYSVDRTVGELLENNKGILCDYYIINNFREIDPVYDGMNISLTSSESDTFTKTEKIAFKSKYIEDNTMPKGMETILVEGKDGEVQINVEEVYVNDTLFSKNEVKKVVTEDPVEQIIRIGTATSIDGITYKSALNVVATGYTPYDPGCIGITASGKEAKFGMIAADTDVLPFGTKIYVPGYGVGVVEDRGGAIKGNRIDLCYETVDEALNWGVRDITIYILE